MKLSFKIFLGICIPSIISSLIITIFLINKDFDKNIENEIQLAITNVEKIEMRANYSSYNDRLFALDETYYKNREAKIYYYKNEDIVYKTDETLEEYVKEYSNPIEGKYFAIQKEINNRYYIIISTRINDENVLIYTENVDNIYNLKKELLTNCIFIFVLMILVIAIIAYIISKTLTKPLVNIQKEMVKLSKGDYKINLKESSSEFGKLAKNFNKMSKELEKRNNELEEYANSKQLFIDNLAHEMNTPLTSIQGYAELMQKANLNEEQKVRYLSYIESESKRISDMYKKLLLLSYKKQSDLEFKDVYMSVALNEVVDLLKGRLENKNIELIINNQLEKIWGDETLIIMSITNLVKNAINISEENSKIIINAFNLNEKKYIQVVDFGCGISKENIDKITEPFYRVDKVRSRKNGGAGLGLSICKSIMELHGGALKIESELGKGSIFILEFPNK